MTNDQEETSLALSRRQRSHVLFVLSTAQPGHQEAFLVWYQNAYREEVSQIAGVLSVCHYEQHEVDITRGQFPRLPFHYLGLFELCFDGAGAAEDLIQTIADLH